MNRLGGVDKKHTKMRKLDRPQGIINHQLFNFIHDPCAPPHTGCIDQLIGLAFELKIKLNRISGDASFWACQQSVFAKQTID